MVKEPKSWPFADPRNVAVFTTRDVIFESRPVLLVTHDSEDGTWQFLSGDSTSASEQDAIVVGLGEVVDQDPSLTVLADLALGWRATRATASSPWNRYPAPESESEDD